MSITNVVQAQTSGTFYLQSFSAAPYPFDPYDGMEPITTLDAVNRIYLVEDSAEDYGTLQGLNSLSRMSAMDAPSPGEGSETNGYYSSSFDYVVPTNGLYLTIEGVANGLAYVNLRHATNKIYEVWSKMDLAATNWNIELEVSPTNAAAMPFRVPQLNRTNLFLWARDWTGITSHGNTAPEWWLWKYFGMVDLLDTNLDNQSHTFRYDYTNSFDPNVITFSLQFTNYLFNASPANGTVAIQGGTPSYIAVLVNDTNLAHASWQPYTSTTVPIYFTSGDGLYNIQVGLRGLPSDARQSWVSAQLTLNNVAQTFIVTNPTNSTVSVPMIQLQGYVSASLSKLTYDVSNAAGIFTNQQAYWQPLFYNTNLLAFTTNSFQCYDIALTNGLNRITLYATDVAGNSITTNFSYTLDYSGDTTAPVLSVLWPTNGTSIAGSNVTFQANMDDVTAVVTATINSNTVAGLVERSGAVWFNDLPLNNGTNIVTITATDAAGNISTTNFNIVQSLVSLTINPISDSQLNRTNVTVSGTIGDSSEKVRVNGVLATVSGTNWMATNVLVSPIGTAGLNVQVNDSSNNLLAVQSLYQPQPAQVVLASYKSQTNYTYQTIVFAPPLNRSFYNVGIDSIAAYWSYGAGGVWHYHNTPYDTEVGPYDVITALPAGANGLSSRWENVDRKNSFEGNAVVSPGYPEQVSEYDYAKIQTHVMIQPSGQQSVGQSMLYLVQAQVTNTDTGLRLLGNAAQIRGATLMDTTHSDGSVWSEALVSAPAGALNVEVTPQASGNYSFNGMLVTNVMLKIIDANTGTNLTLQPNIVMVGQQMNMFCQLSITNHVLANFQWTVPGITFSNYVANSSSGTLFTDFPTTHSNVVFYWVNSGIKQVQCSATVNGKIITGQATFNVLKPTAVVTATTSSVGIYDLFNPPELKFFDTATFAEGITFSNTMTVPSGFSGSNEWVQIVLSPYRALQTTNNVWWTLTNNGSGPYLDTSYPYTNKFGVTANVVSDSPSQSLPNGYRAGVATDSFEMWLMFKPTGGQWVPLRTVNWNWSGTASLSGTNWVVNSRSWSTNPPSADAGTTFPQWNNNVRNLTFQEQP